MHHGVPQDNMGYSNETSSGINGVTSQQGNRGYNSPSVHVDVDENGYKVTENTERGSTSTGERQLRREGQKSLKKTT